MTKQGLSARTVRYTHTVLRDALEQAVKWQMIPKNPTQHVDLPKQKKAEITVMSTSDVKAFLEAAKETPWYTLLAS